MPHKKQTCANSTVEFMKPSGCVLQLVLSVGPMIYLEAKQQQTRILNPSSACGEVALRSQAASRCNKWQQGAGLPFSCAPRAHTALPPRARGQGSAEARSYPDSSLSTTQTPHFPLGNIQAILPLSPIPSWSRPPCGTSIPE